MTGRMIRKIATTTVLATVVSSTGCGHFLYPERRGNSSDVDGGTLVMDLLWLLPGIIPGVVALIVDFSSGAIYTRGGGHAAVRMSRDGRVAVRLPDSPKPAQLEFRLVTADHRVLAKKTALVGPTVHGQSVELQIADSVQPRPSDKIVLEVKNAVGETARFAMSIELAR